MNSFSNIFPRTFLRGGRSALSLDLFSHRGIVTHHRLMSSVSEEDAHAFDRIINARRSVYQFDVNKRIEKEDMDKILLQTLRSPSGFNVQPFKCIVVQDNLVKKRLAQCMLAGNAKKVLDAPVTIVFAADLRPEELLNDLAILERKAGASTNQIKSRLFDVKLLVGGDGSSAQSNASGIVRDSMLDVLSTFAPMVTSTSIKSWSYKNTALAVQSYLLACTAKGIGTAPMEGFDGRRIREVLGIPDRYEIPVVVSTGYESELAYTKASLRYRPDSVVCKDGFDHPWIFPEEGLAGSEEQE